MEVLSILNELEELIDSSRSVFGNKATIDKGKAIELITDIRIGLPDDFKQAEWISQERQRIIYDAQAEAEKIVSEARLEAEAIVEEDSITQAAYKKATGIVAEAEYDAKELRNGAVRYSQDILKKISKDMKNLTEKVITNYKDLGNMLIEDEEDEIEIEM
ncbi:MAG: ATPase [Proteocatella sp.]